MAARQAPRTADSTKAIACEDQNIQHQTPNVEQGILPIYALADR